MDLSSLGKEPVNQTSPSGTDIRYEPVFEELQAEIDILSSPSAALKEGGARSIDWQKIARIASKILAEHSKDILVASYLAVAQIYNEKHQGIVQGAGLYRDILEHFWETLYPPKKRMKGRVGAIEWWLEKTEAALAQMEPAPLSDQEVQSLEENLAGIRAFLSENLEELISIRPLEEYLERIKAISVEKAAPTPMEVKDEPKPPAGKTPTAAPPPYQGPEMGEITSVKDAQKVLNFGIQKIRQAMAYISQENPTDPQIYRWTRSSIWAGINALPPATEGRTLIPAPEEQVQAILTNLLDRGDFAALLNSAESRVPQFIFWLDLSCWSAQALAGLGSAYQKARDAVCQETAYLIQRLPGLEDLTFSDGTPFAREDSRKWLQKNRFSSDESASQPVDLPHSLGESNMEEEIAKAKALVRDDKLVEALQSLQQNLRNSQSQQERLHWRLAMSQILLSSGRAELVPPHLDQILRDIDTYRLEEWDPELAIKGLKTVWMGFGAQKGDSSKAKVLETLNRIARLDPAEALRLGKTR